MPPKSLSRGAVRPTTASAMNGTPWWVRLVSGARGCAGLRHRRRRKQATKTRGTTPEL
jgi:hypothetical protein